MAVLLSSQLNKNSLGRVNPTGGDAVARTDKSNSPNSRCSEILQPPVKSEWERINIWFATILTYALSFYDMHFVTVVVLFAILLAYKYLLLSRLPYVEVFLLRVFSGGVI